MISKRGRFRDLFGLRSARVIAAATLAAVVGGCQEGGPLLGDPFEGLGEPVASGGQIGDLDNAAIDPPDDTAPPIALPVVAASVISVPATAAPRRPFLPSARRPVAGADKVAIDEPDSGQDAAPPSVLDETQLLDRQMVDPDLAGPDFAGPGWIEPVDDAPETEEEDTIPGNAPPGERLDALLSAGRHEAAADLVLDNKAYFRQHWLAYKDRIDRIAAALNAARDPALFEALGFLVHFRWPAPQDAWPAMRRALQDAQSVLDDYLEHPFLRDPPYRSSFADDLSRRIERSRERIARFAGERFILYDHISGPSFFDMWPLELDAAQFMDDIFKHVQGRLADKPRADLDRFLTHYPAGDVLTGDALSHFSDIYLAALISEQRSPAAAAPTRLQDHLLAWQAARDRGLNPSGFGGLRIAVAVQTPIEEPDAPLPALHIDRDVAEAEDPEDADYVIMLEAGTVRVARNVILRERVPSLYLGPPEEGIADGDPAVGYFEALAVTDAPADTPRSETSGGNPLQFLVSFFSGGESEAAEGDAPGAEVVVLSQPATTALAVTADFRDYAYTREKVEASKNLTINATAIDRATGEETLSTFDVTFRRRFVRVTGVRANDPGRAAHLANADDDQAIAAWEKRPVTLPVSLVLGYFREE